MSGIGGMVLNFFKGTTPNKYTEIFTPLKTFMSGKSGTLATLRSLIDNHLKSITKETPVKTAKRVRQDFSNTKNNHASKQGTNDTDTVIPPTVPTPPHPSSTISPSDMDTKHNGETGDDNKEEKRLEETDEEDENPLNPTKKSKTVNTALPNDGRPGTGGAPRPPIPPPSLRMTRAKKGIVPND